MSRSLSLLALTASLALVGCSTAPKSQSAREDLRDSSQTALRRFERQDSSLASFLNNSAGYAIFPNVGKGGLGVGGSYGKGVLYQHGQFAGFCDLSQASVGFQAGGQSYAELIVFENDQALRQFKRGEYGLTAEASAVAIKPGASGQAQFNHGVAVFTATNAGLMYEAAVAGQKFRYNGDTPPRQAD